MRRKNVYKLSVLLAVIGLSMVYASSFYMATGKVDIGSIKKSQAGKNVRIEGHVTSFSRPKNTAFVTVEDSTGAVQVVDFDSSLDLRTGESVTVKGNVNIYHGELEIVADSVRQRSG